MKKRKICSCILTLILILTCIPISSNGVATPKFLEKADTSISASASENNAALYATNKIKNKKYTISKQTGTYSTPIKIKIKAKKGYKIYYSLNGKFKAKKVIKSKKKKTITISSTKTLQIYAVKSSKKVTNKKLKAKAVKKCKNYTYTIQGQTNENSGDSINPSDNKNNLDNEKNNNAHDQDNPKQDIENDYNNPSEENTSTESTIENTPSTGTTEEATTMDLTIDQKDFSTEDENITLSGTYDGDIKKLTYKIVFGKSEEITNGNISYSENKWSLALNNLKIGENNITITAIDQNGKEISKSVQVILEGLYEYSENDIVTDEETGISYVKNTILIFFENDVTENEQKEIIESVSGSIIGKDSTIHQMQIRVPETDYPELKRAIEFLENIDGVVCATLDVADNIDLSATLKYPADGKTDYQQYAWWYTVVNANAIPIYQKTNIDIGIIDGGFDFTHEDLDLINISDIETTDTEHGTVVAGVIGAKKNDIGMTGIAQNHDIYCFNYATATGNSKNLLPYSRILRGLTETINHGAKVVNLSLGNTVPMDSAEKDEIGKEWSAYIYSLIASGYDFLIVEAAGNSASDAANYDYCAAITKENCVSFGDITVDDVMDKYIIVANAEYLNDGSFQLSSDSNIGDCVDIAAIGQDVFTTTPGGYDYANGTSISAPMVTGAIAGIWEMDPTMTSKEVKDIILGTANNIVTLNPDYPNASIGTRTTYPLLNIKGAVEKLYGTLSGQVLDENNTPIDNVTIEIRDNRNTKIATIYTDNNGKFIYNLPRGNYSIDFIKQGYSNPKMDVTIESRTITALIDPIIMSTNNIGIQGNVVDGDGAPLSEVLIEIKKSNTEDVVTTATTDENGEYSITLENGGYDITFSKDGYESVTLNDIVVLNDVSKLNEVAMNLTALTIFSGGDGSKENPYQITNEEEFRKIANYPNDHFILMNDLDLSDSPRIEEFNGTFDGNGKTVKPGFSSKNGLFVVLKENAVIRNFIIDIGYNTELPDFFSTYDGNFYAPLALNNYGLVEKCQIKGTIYCYSDSGYVFERDCHLGGIIAIVNGTGIVSKCRNSVFMYFSRKTDGGIYWGGIAARSGGQIKDCLVDGDCYITHYIQNGIVTEPWTVAGGIIAENGTCSNCVIDSKIQISHLAENTNYHLRFGVIYGWDNTSTTMLPIEGKSDCYISDDYSLNVRRQYYGSAGGLISENQTYNKENITNTKVMPHEEVEEWYNSLLQSE